MNHRLIRLLALASIVSILLSACKPEDLFSNVIDGNDGPASNANNESACATPTPESALAAQASNSESSGVGEIGAAGPQEPVTGGMENVPSPEELNARTDAANPSGPITAGGEDAGAAGAPPAPGSESSVGPSETGASATTTAGAVIEVTATPCP
jgi:hypothetical protein